AANITHAVGGFRGVHYSFIGSGIDDVVLNRGRGLLALFIHSQVVNLHPEIQPLAALERSRLAIDIEPGTHFRRANHEVTCAYILGSNLFHLIGQDKAGVHKLVIAESRNHQAGFPGSYTVTLHILTNDVDAITAWL